MLLISATEHWRATHPGAVIGLLELSGAENNRASLALDARKRETEERLRERYRGYTRREFLSLPVMAAYEKYYKKFQKTYHVLLQLESVVLKGKSLPDVSPLVDSNFMAEVETLVLTAGHDVAKLQGPVSIDAAREGDRMTQMNDTPKAMLSGDMVMRDADGLSCSILYGQDNRSPISADTSRVLYVAYAPVGVPAAAVEAQLQQIEENVRLFSPQAVVEQKQLLEGW